MQAITPMRIAVAAFVAVLTIVVQPSAQSQSYNLKGAAEEPESSVPGQATVPDQPTLQQLSHVPSTKVRPGRTLVGTPVHSEPQALPHWSGSFKATTGANRTATTQTYSYTMVGTDPSAGGTSTTTVRTILVPVRLQFADGSVFDASTDPTDPLNTSVLNNVLASPQFTPTPVYSGAVNLGTTQYADAVQRGNFWNYVSRNKPDYHVLLKPEVYPTQTVVLAADQGYTYTYSPGIRLGVVTGPAMDNFTQTIAAQVQDPSALLIFLVHNVLTVDGAAAGYHDVLPLGGGVEQTYIVSGYFDRAYGLRDIDVLSHEVSEWLNDPFVDNIVPVWSFVSFPSSSCSSRYTSLLEVGDPVEFLLNPEVNLPAGGVTWHPQDIVFLPWFERALTSTSVNGWYTFANGTPGPGEPCISSGDYNYTTLDFPGAGRTRAIGVNNRGTVVGRYRLAGVVHGFIFQNGQYTSLDVPGASSTNPQGINDQGQVVGNIFDSNGNPHGFSYRAGVFKLIDVPGALFTGVFGINNSGVIVGYYGDANNFTPYGYNLLHAFQLSHGVFTTIPAPPFAYESFAYGINNSGTMVGGYDDNGDQTQNYALSGEPGSFAPFTLPGATGPIPGFSLGSDSQTLPYGVNNQNDVVGFYYEYGDPTDYFPAGFVWHGQTKTWQKLDVPGAWYTDLYGINDKGTIVGDYQDRKGIHGVVLTSAGK